MDGLGRMSFVAQIATTLISLAVGIGVAWGTMRNTVTRLSDKVDKLDELLPHLQPLTSQVASVCVKVDDLTDKIADVRIEIAEVRAVQRAREGRKT
jgi:hypothetical protein